MSKYTSIITTVTGQSLLAQSVSTQKPLIFTSIRLGDGVLEPSDITANFTALKAEKMIAPINTFDDSLISTGKVTLISTIDNSGVEAGFYAREVGVYAKVGESGTEQLFAYCNAGNYGDYMPDKNSELNETRLAVQLAVGSAANVTAIINSQQYATLENVTDAIAGHDEGVNPHAGVLLKIDDLEDKMLERLAGDDEISLTGLAKSSIFYRLMTFANEANTGAAFCNSRYGGKFLGNAFTEEQSANIQNGTFKGMNAGDFWTINGINWRIGGANYWLKVGDTSFDIPHLVIVPDTVLYSEQMHKTSTGEYISGEANNSTNGGYKSSYVYGTISRARQIVYQAFGQEHVPKHRILLPKDCTGGKYTSWEWSDEDVILMNEVMVLGTRAWGDSANNGYSVGSQNLQLPLFAMNPESVHIRSTYWLMDVASAVYFANVNGYGNAHYAGASHRSGVRPAFALI